MFVNCRNLSRLLLSIAGVLFLLLPQQSAGAQAQDVDLCNHPLADPVRAISACTRLLNGDSEGPQSAGWYNNRGIGKLKKGYVKNAIEDFTEALNRNPDYFEALQNRGIAYHTGQDFNTAIDDFNRALLIDSNSKKAAPIYNMRGLSLSRKGEYPRAIEDFGTAIKLNDQYAQAYISRGDAYYATRQFALAIADFNTAIKLARTNPLVYIHRGDARVETAEFGDAISDYSAAIGLDPNSWEAYSHRGEAWRLQRDLVKSIADHNKAIQLNPTAKEAYINRAFAWGDQEGKLNNAIDDCTEAILRDSNYALAYADRGRFKRLKGVLKGSLDDLDKAVKLDPGSPIALAFRGDTLRESGNIDGAMADFNQAILILPDYAAAYTGRGLTYEKKGELANAKADFEKALSLPVDVDAGLARPAQALARERLVAIAVGRAATLMDKGDYKGAISSYGEALRLNPNNSGVYTRRGEAWRLQGNLQQALEDHNKAIAFNPNDVEAYNNRALTFKDQGKLDEALADWDAAIRLNPASYLAYTNRGMVRQLRGDLQGSLTDLNQAVDLDPRSPKALTFRGDTLRELGYNDRATKDFNDAIRIAPDFVAAYTGRGLTYEKIGDSAKAKADFEKASSLPAELDVGLASPAQALARERLAALPVPKDSTATIPQSVPEDIRKLLDHRGHALLIGVSDYSSGWDKLPGVKDDLRKLEEGLKASFETVEIVPNPTVDQIRFKIRNFLMGQWNKANERLLIYYSGHGFTDQNPYSRKKEGYITGIDTPLYIPADGRATANAMPFDEVVYWSGKSNARHVLMVFDSCFSGSLFASKSGPPAAAQYEFDSVQNRLRFPIRYVITAGRGNETVSAGSIFADSLLRGLRGEADFSHKGIVAADQLGVYLSTEVPRLSGGRQTPQYDRMESYENEGQFFFLTKPAAP